MNYKVHLAYLTQQGVVVKAGIYSDAEIDVAEAQKRTIITPVFSGVELKEEKLNTNFSSDNPLDVTKVSLSDSGIQYTSENTIDDVVTTKVFGEVTQLSIPTIKINTASEKDITDLKHVGKKTATKLIKLRNQKWFTSYADLDNKVPLLANKKWKDIALVDFEESPEVNLSNNVSFTDSNNYAARPNNR